MRLPMSIALMAACTAPNYGNGHLQCAQAGRACPDGFYCAADHHCWLTGSGPGSDGGSVADMAASSSDLAPSPGSDLAVPPSTCGGLSVLFCDGFEDPTLNAKWDTVSTTNGNDARDSGRVYRGKGAFLSHVNASMPMTGPQATLAKNNAFSLTSGTLHVRLWAYFPSPLPADYNQFLVLADAAGANGVSVASAHGHIVLNVYNNQFYKESATPIPLDRWTCVQIDVAQGAATGQLGVFLDSVPVADLSPVTTTPAVVTLYLGLSFYANPDAVADYTAWFDEIIVDNKPTPCGE